MKKLFLPIFLVVLFSIAFVGCNKPQNSSASTTDSSKSESENKPTAKKIKIGVSLPTQREERWIRDKGTFEKYAKELGIEVIVQISDADMAIQSQQFKSLISQGVNAIIIAPHDSGAAGTLVDEAKSEGIPVVSYGRLVLNTPNLAGYASIAIKDFGVVQGKYLANLVPKGNYILLAGAPTDSAAKLYREGSLEALQPLVDSGDIKIVTDQAVENWLPENAKKIVENSLTSNANNIQAVLAPNDGTAGGAIAALQAQGLAGQIPVTGQDAEFSALKRIKDGTQSMDVYADTVQQAKNAMDMAVLLAQGKPLDIAKDTMNNGAADIPSMFLPPITITKDNLTEQATKLFNDGLLSQEQFDQLK